MTALTLIDLPFEKKNHLSYLHLSITIKLASMLSHTVSSSLSLCALPQQHFAQIAKEKKIPSKLMGEETVLLVLLSL